MGSLEEEVTKLMRQTVEGNPTMLAATTGLDDPHRKMTPAEEFRMIEHAMRGMVLAIQRLAREIDEMREA